MQLLWRKAVHTHTCTVYSTQKDCYALQKTVLFLIRSVRNRETTMVSRKPLPPPKKKKKQRGAQRRANTHTDNDKVDAHGNSRSLHDPRDTFTRCVPVTREVWLSLHLHPRCSTVHCRSPKNGLLLLLLVAWQGSRRRWRSFRLVQQWWCTWKGGGGCGCPYHDPFGIPRCGRLPCRPLD